MEPMSESDQENVDLLVHAYVDDELDVANGLAIKRKIDADPALANSAAEIQALKSVLRAKFPSEALPPHLKRRIDRLHSKSPMRYRPTWGSMAAAVTVAIALSSFSTYYAAKISTSDAVTIQVVDSHLRSLIAQQPTDIASSDRHTVKPWYNGKVSQSPRVKDLAEAGYPLAGGRVDVLNKVAVPTLVYNRRRHVISVTAAPLSVSGPDVAAVSGFNIVRWNEGDMSYWTISDLNTAELNEFSKLYRQAP